MDEREAMSGWAMRDVMRIHRERRYRDPALGGSTEPDHRHAIVLAAGPGERLLRLTERLTGAALPKQFCAFDDDQTLLQRSLRRIGRHVAAARTRVVIDRRHRCRAIAQLAGLDVQVLAQPEDCGTAVGVLVPLIDILIDDPEAVVVIAPADHAFEDAAAFDQAVGDALRIAEDNRAAVVLGAEPDGSSGDDGWLVPFAPLRPGLRSAVQPVSRYLPPCSATQTAALVQAGAVHSTSLVVVSGAALLELYERVTPRLLRLFLYGAAMPPAASSAFVELAYDGLGELDFCRELLALAHDLRMVVLPRQAGFSDLGTEARLLAWLAKRRSAAMMPWPLARGAGQGYRRVHERRNTPDALSS